MRNLFTLLVLCFTLSSAFTQTQPRTLVETMHEKGWFGGINLNYGRYINVPTLSGALQGGLVLNRKVKLGLEVGSTIAQEEIMVNRGNRAYSKNLALGIITSYMVKPDKLVSFSGDLFIGGGKIIVPESRENRSTNYFLVRPEIKGAINITSMIKAYIGVGINIHPDVLILYDNASPHLSFGISVSRF